MPMATTKPVAVVYFPLTTSADCAGALEAALTIGFRGSVGAYMQDGGALWAVELSGGPLNQKVVMVDDSGTIRPPTIGDVYVWDGSRLSCHTLAGFQAAYTAE